MYKAFATSGVILSICLVLAFFQDYSREWKKIQSEYKSLAYTRASNNLVRESISRMDIKIQQDYLPGLGIIDRCRSCHLGIENPVMKNVAQPFALHSGTLLKNHPPSKFGCTLCHQGQGLATSAKKAHAVDDPYWERPILSKPFIYASCERCHRGEDLKEAVILSQGRKLFIQKGCIGCHKIYGEGGIQGPELTGLGEASIYIKHPVAKNMDQYHALTHGNTNLAYILESIAEPAIQPTTSIMPDLHMSQEEILALGVYIKGLTNQDIPSFLRSKKSYGIIPAAGTAAIPSMGTVQIPTPVSGPVSGTIQGSSVTAVAGEQIFQKACAACHTIGQGQRVGPDLAGVHQRRSQEWLEKFVKSPQSMIKSGDANAVALFQKFNQLLMPDAPINSQEIQEILSYIQFASRTPKKTAVHPQAESKQQIEVLPTENKIERQHVAAEEDILNGQKLFLGTIRLKNGGASCHSCHDTQGIRKDVFFGGGLLARELTLAFSRMGENGIRAVLENPPFPVMKAAFQDKALTQTEISSLIAFLKHAANTQRVDQRTQRDQFNFLISGSVGGILLIGLYSLIWWRRKKQSVNEEIFHRQGRSLWK